MRELLRRAQWQARKALGDKVFLPPDPAIADELVALWRKYRDELAEFADAYVGKYRGTTEAGFEAVFGDVEGELLYILVRELKPELVYEISPNSGSSTNYLLAAVTRNGTGRIEGFEIEPSFNGVPTREVIAAHQIAMCDFSRYNLNIGDARDTVVERLAKESPDFCLIDSWHVDVFAEFYVHKLIPRVRGTLVVQDIAHFDPRPEWATEAYYLLTHLQLTGTELVPIAAYEDLLNASGARDGLTPRRAMRSNSIVLHVGQGEHAADPMPGRRYHAAWQGQVDQDDPAICDILAMWRGRAALSRRMAESLAARFADLDPCQQVMAVEVLARDGDRQTADRLLTRLDPASIGGAELPLSLARTALLLDRVDLVEAMAGKIRGAARDPGIATAYRQLLELADLLYRCGRGALARAACDAAIDGLKARRFNPRKVGLDLATFCLKHPAHFPDMRRVGLSGRSVVEVTATAGRAMLRAAAARAVRRLRA